MDIDPDPPLKEAVIVKNDEGPLYVGSIISSEDQTKSGVSKLLFSSKTSSD